MRKNEFASLEQFKTQYCGVWSPSDDHWYGLDFAWNGKEYRLHTGLMYSNESSTLPDGKAVLFSLYEKVRRFQPEYHLLCQFASMDDLLKSRVIDGRLFSEIIMHDDTVLMGQD